jgi:hypothetical protein
VPFTLVKGHALQVLGALQNYLFPWRNVLLLQETLLGCKSEMPGNLIFLEIIFSIISVGLDQDEYPNLWIVSSRQSNYIHATQGLQELFIR